MTEIEVKKYVRFEGEFCNSDRKCDFFSETYDPEVGWVCEEFGYHLEEERELDCPTDCKCIFEPDEDKSECIISTGRNYRCQQCIIIFGE